MLNVSDPPERVTLTKSRNDTIFENQQLTLQCNAGGNPTPNEFTWSHDSKPIDEESSERAFEKIRRSDAGRYVCTAKNGITPDGDSNAETVIVHCK